MDNIRSRRQVVAVVSQVAILSVSVQGTCWGAWQWHVNIRHLDPLPRIHYGHGLCVLRSSEPPGLRSPHHDMDTRAGPGIGPEWLWPYAAPLTQHASEIPLLTPWSHPICSTRYKLDTGNRFQTRSLFSKYFYVSGMLCGKWGFDKSGNCVRVPTLVGSVSSDFLFDNNRLQSLSVFAPHLNYSLHKNISQNTQSIRNQHK